MFKLFKRKPEEPKRLREYLNIKFEEALITPKPEHLTNLKDHLGTEFKEELKSSYRPLFLLSIMRIL